MKSEDLDGTPALILRLIEKIRTVDPERGLYLSRHIKYNIRQQTITYTGSKTLLKDILDKTTVTD
jgi:hypothetical protein